VNHRFAVEWLKAFRESPEKVCKLYADDFLFEDLMLDQSITDKDELHRAFAPYANADLTNGVGVHHFRIDEVIGDERAALIRWSWRAHGADTFLGIPTNGKVVGTSGHTFHIYENGLIKRESTYWDATSVLRELGQPVSTRGVTAPSASPSRPSRVSVPAHAPQLHHQEYRKTTASQDRQDHAHRWTTALSSDTDAAVEMYADDLVYDDRNDIDHVYDTATNKAELRERIAPFANTDPGNGLGIHRFEVLDVLDATGAQGSRAVTILWRWTGEHLASFRGVPVPAGTTLTTRGQSWHQLDADGKIVRESTFWNDVPVFQALGLPVLTPHYWAADFDPNSLGS